jgi:hypothetical protein
MSLQQSDEIRLLIVEKGQLRFGIGCSRCTMQVFLGDILSAASETWESVIYPSYYMGSHPRKVSRHAIPSEYVLSWMKIE